MRKCEFGQGSESRSDFHEVIIPIQGKLPDDPIREILVVQKILAEAFARMHGELLERGLDGGEFHDLSASAGCLKSRIFFFAFLREAPLMK